MRPLKCSVCEDRCKGQIMIQVALSHELPRGYPEGNVSGSWYGPYVVQREARTVANHLATMNGRHWGATSC